MGFQWDPVKARSNERKHSVSFEEAASIFRDFCLIRLDARRDYGEPRWVALGLDSNGVVLDVVYTVRGEDIRIISARKASKHERQSYEETRAARSVRKS
jgi:uncharacterized DUF497 family protein